VREEFVPKTFTPAHLEVIAQAEAICADYAAQGMTMSLRQVYYQFVSRDLLANKQTEYKRLGGILNDARMAGLLDWSYLEDRGREVNGSFGGWSDPGTFISRMAGAYSERVWEGQDYRPEVWVEKDALSSIIEQACGPTRTPSFACKGYVSGSAMYEAAVRMRRRVRDGLIPVVIHLGDHDPSGIDMTRDIQERLTLMVGEPVDVVRIALNRDQIDLYGPPPNPAKITDSRAQDYIAQHGRSSWELDALDPTVLRDLVADTIEGYLDRPTFNAAVEAEEANTERLQVITDRWSDLEDHWDDVLAVIGADE
jgi:hypothetical protein